MKNILTDSNGTWSWRKAITCLVSLTLIICCLGFEMWDWKELPSGYQMLMATVISFYFFRRKIDRISTKDQA